jgi:hypothetical protein
MINKWRTTLGKLRQEITTMMKYQDPPTFIVIHIGGNDIRASKVGIYEMMLKMSYCLQVKF